jgi:hypothetical protein
MEMLEPSVRLTVVHNYSATRLSFLLYHDYVSFVSIRGIILLDPTRTSG